MSNELESDRANGGEFRIIGADGVGYYETETEPPRPRPSRQVRQTRSDSESEDHVSGHSCMFPA